MSKTKTAPKEEVTPKVTKVKTLKFKSVDNGKTFEVPADSITAERVKTDIEKYTVL